MNILSEILLLNILFLLGIIPLSIALYKQIRLLYIYANGVKFYRRALTLIVAGILAVLIYLETAYFHLLIGKEEMWKKILSDGYGIIIVVIFADIAAWLLFFIYEENPMEFLSWAYWKNKIFKK